MALYFFLVLFFFCYASAENRTNYCHFNQGQIDMCHMGGHLMLRLPLHAQKVFFGRIEDSEIDDPISLMESDLERLRRPYLPVFSGAATARNCKVEAADADFVRYVDISDRNISNESWYALCAEYDVVTKGEDRRESMEMEGNHSIFSIKPAPGQRMLSTLAGRRKRNAAFEARKCTRCSLIKAIIKSDAALPKLLQAAWVKDRLALIDRREAGILQYATADFPFESAKIFGRVIDLEEKRQVFQFNNVIKPRQQIFIDVPRAEEGSRYAVITDFTPLDKNGTQFVIGDVPLAFQDYVRVYAVEERGPGSSSGSKSNDSPGLPGWDQLTSNPLLDGLKKAFKGFFSN